MWFGSKALVVLFLQSRGRVRYLRDGEAGGDMGGGVWWAVRGAPCTQLL